CIAVKPRQRTERNAGLRCVRVKPLGVLLHPGPVDKGSWERPLEEPFQPFVAVDDGLGTILHQVRNARGKGDLISQALFPEGNDTLPLLPVPPWFVAVDVLETVCVVSDRVFEVLPAFPPV